MSVLLQLLDVRAGNKGPSCADDDNGGNSSIVLGLVDGSRDPLGHPRRKRIDGRIINRYDIDAVRYRYSNHFSHVYASIRWNRGCAATDGCGFRRDIHYT